MSAVGLTRRIFGYLLPIQMLGSGHFFSSPVVALTAPSLILLSPLGERLGEGPDRVDG